MDTQTSNSIARPWYRRPARLVLAGLTALILVAAFYLWFVLLSPFGHQPPEGYPAIDPTREHKVFVYGTLRNPLVRLVVMGSMGDPRPATLPGYRKQGLDLAVEPGSATEGLVFIVTVEQLRRLDRYERIGIRYERFEYTLEDGTRAWVYRRLPE
ncbi:gamma-glutamylcyclotransferase family protein [Marinimicrobium sp. ABcell2]|uniref:gamma-glutamylcyclotransferase family protein n=1 Tax=Marinimicrobium sp. ABcell2 TaxID=3069751 RepID=UPI0027B192C6|nr:gamma-glutamylcyclotransferase family protein [Marinimicrobium sp. ABcell2]MDQ2075936.1 gamma-glutamylcyclotransferase family protein [Marinimicrobium sp. ABcell2]